MANYVGTPWEGKPFEYKSDVPLDLIAKGLALKQGQTDTVKQQMQGYLDNLGNTQFYKDTDREIVNQRISETVNSLNSFAGPDLTDGRTQNELASVVNGLSNDPDVLDRIVANRNVGRQMSRIQSIKEHHPDQWSGVNEDYFMKQVNAWKSDPNKKSFNETYRPYVNTSEWYQKAAEDIAKNPDMYNEIHYANINGVQVPRSETEVKEVTLKKIYEGLMGSMPGAVRSQFELEYKNGMQDNGLQIAMGSINKDISDVQALRNNLKYAYENAYSDKMGTVQQVTDKLAKYEAKIKELENKRNSLEAGVARPEEFVTLNDYLDDKMLGVAKSYAYKQTKDKDDGLGMALLKHKWDQDDIKLTAALKNKPETPEKFTNDLLASISDLGARGQASVKTKQAFQAYMGIATEPDPKDGYYIKTFANSPIFADMKPLVQTVVPDADNRQAAGYQMITHEYAKWRAQKLATPLPQVHVGSHGEILNSYPTPDMLPMSQYLEELKKTPGAVEAFQKDYNLNITDGKVMNNAAVVQTKVNKLAAANISTMTIGSGDLKIKPYEGMNLRGSSNSLPYMGVNGKGTAEQLYPILGGEAVFDAWKEQGFVREIGKDENGDRVYQADIWSPVTGDIGAIGDDFNNRYYGAGYYKDNATDLNNAVANKWAVTVAATHYNNPAQVDEMAKAITTAYPNTSKRIADQIAIIQSNATSSDQKNIAVLQLKAWYNQLHASNQPKSGTTDPKQPATNEYKWDGSQH